MLLTDIIDRYEREYLHKYAPRTQKEVRRNLNKLRGLWGPDKQAEDLQPREVGAFLYQEDAPQQRNRLIALLSVVYSKAIARWWLLERNPCSKIERNPSSPRTRYITDGEFLKVYDLAPERVQLAMTLAYLLGQRQSDIMGLKWSNISQKGILITQGKTGKTLLIGMSAAVAAVLRKAWRMGPVCEFVIPTSFAKRYTPEGFRTKWQQVMNKAMELRVIVERFTFHDIRAKTVSDDPSLQAASDRAAHGDIRLTDRVYKRNVKVVTPLM